MKPILSSSISLSRVQRVTSRVIETLSETRNSSGHIGSKKVIRRKRGFGHFRSSDQHDTMVAFETASYDLLLVF